MTFLALAIQPTQYILYSAAGRALAAGYGCIPVVPPENEALRASHFTEPPCPALPPMQPAKPMTAPAVHYYLLPGIGDKDVSGTSRYFDKTHLGAFLQSSWQRGGPRIWVQTPAAHWRTQGIAQQGEALAAQIQQDVGHPKSKVILVGHSMGGLRARAAYELSRETYPKMGQVVGLINLGSPQLGAPIIDNARPASTKLGAVMGAALGFHVGPHGSLIGAVGGMMGLNQLASQTVLSPSGQDMRPGSTFLQRVNEPLPSQKLPADLPVLDFIGKNNDIDALGASSGLAGSAQAVRTMRQSAATYLSIGAALALATAPVTLGVSLAVALAFAAAAALLARLPTFWRQEVVGSDEGDAVVPLHSQYVPALAGGRRTSQELPFAVHVGKQGEYAAQKFGEYNDALLLRQRMIRFQREVGVPESRLDWEAP